MGIGLVGLIVMAASTNTKLRYGFAHVCMSGVFVGGPLIAVWLAGNTPWKGSRSVILGINGWSNLAGVIAGQIFKSKYAPRCKFLELLLPFVYILSEQWLTRRPFNQTRRPSSSPWASWPLAPWA